MNILFKFPTMASSHKQLLTADAWRRFSVLRLRQKNGAKRLLWSGFIIRMQMIHQVLQMTQQFFVPRSANLNRFEPISMFLE
jgi:hypothetical protein